MGGPITIDRDTIIKAIALDGRRRSVRTAEATLRKFDDASLRLPARPLEDAPSEPGTIRVRAYEGGWQSLHDLPSKEPVIERTVDRIDPSSATRSEHVALVFTGLLRVPRRGVYSFHLASDDGSRLHLGDTLLIDNDGLHGVIEKSAHAPLSPCATKTHGTQARDRRDAA